MSTLDTARDQLAPYGYGLDPNGHFTKGEKTLSVRLEAARGRFQARTVAAGSLLWSGLDAGNFVSTFWFAQKTPQ